MANRNILVTGTYLTGDQVAAATARFEESGFPSDDLSQPIPFESGFQLTVQCDSPVSVLRAENLLRQTGAREVTSEAQNAVSSEASGGR